MRFFKNDIDDLVVKNFIERVCIDFEVELERTQRELGENPLCYREKTMSSFLFPALQHNSVGTLLEREIIQIFIHQIKLENAVI